MAEVVEKDTFTGKILKHITEVSSAVADLQNSKIRADTRISGDKPTSAPTEDKDSDGNPSNQMHDMLNEIQHIVRECNEFLNTI